jgi:hypothetical protein
VILNNNSARFEEIPAVFAILEITLVLDLKTFEPAPKSVTSIVLLFARSEFLYFLKTAYSGLDFLS